MDQIKNLYKNIGINILSIGLYLLCMYCIYPTPNVMAYLCGFFSFLCISMIFSIAEKTLFGENTKKVYPLLSIFLLLIILVHYLTKRTKIIRSIDYSYISVLIGERFVVVKITPYTLEVLYYDLRFCIDTDIDHLHRILDSIHNKPKSKFLKFKEWDGTLDKASKRMKTINRIIK